MTELPLLFDSGHLFAEIRNNLWLIDTGAPTSFGDAKSIMLNDRNFSIVESYCGLTADSLSEFVGVKCSGLLGGDILGFFDHIFDIPKLKLTTSHLELSHQSLSIPLTKFMGIPIVTAQIGNKLYRMFFDTGAQISYLQNDFLKSYPSAGEVSDFYPGYGRFQTDTFQAPVLIGGITFSMRFGCLPGLLGATLTVAGVQGIIGNSLFLGRVVSYFPRRGILSL